MMRVWTGLRWRCGVVIVMALLVMAPAAGAQGIGAGPLTAPLATDAPPSGAIRLGPASIAPGVVVREAGWDSNVFAEAVDPKEDYVVAVAPDAAVFIRLPMLQLSTYGGGDFNWYNTYESENSNGYRLRGRADFLISRIRPFAGAARLRLRERPNGEIDVRANRLEQEWSGGVAYDVSPNSAVYVSAYQTTIRYDNAVEDGVDLSLTLDHSSNNYSVGVRTDLTPLLAMTITGSYEEDEFHNDPLRNTDNRMGTVMFSFASDAIVSGRASVSFKDFQPVDPSVKPFRGLTAMGSLSYSFLEVGRLSFTGQRDNHYSFDTAAAFYVENSVALSYTHRLFGGVDVQVRGGRSLFDYAYSEVVAAHKDTLDTAAGSVGYNLSNRTRISANYEFTRRRSPALPERNYDRRRIYAAWTFAQ